MASNPLRVEFDTNTVKKIATNVIAGNIFKHHYDGREFLYCQTYRLTGEAAPTVSEMRGEMVLMFQDNPEVEPITSQSAIDIYVYAGQQPGSTEKAVLVVAL